MGVVAYVGWNPWDEGSRAFIVVVGHPDGYVTRYGHLIPSRKVRVGQLVRKGQKIGKMGSTGNSTGTHLHMELLRYTTPLDPIAYLPDDGATVRQSRNGKKVHKGKHAHKGKKAEARKANAKRHERAQAKRRKGRDVVVEASGNGVACLTPEIAAAVRTVLSEASFPLGLGKAEVTPTAADESPCANEEPAGIAGSTLDVAFLPIRTLPTQTTLAELATESVRLPLRGTSPIPE